MISRTITDKTGCWFKFNVCLKTLKRLTCKILRVICNIVVAIILKLSLLLKHLSQKLETPEVADDDTEKLQSYR